MAAAFSTQASALDIGVNTHRGWDASTNTQIANLMKQRNLKTARLDLYVDSNMTEFRDQVTKIRANGGKVEVALMISHQWDNSCPQNMATVEQNAYNQTAATVNKVKDIVHDFEMLNEAQLRPDILKEVPWNSAGTSTAPYQGKPCVATLAAVFRGMSRAIKDVRASSGLPLRTIFGVIGRDWGFVTHMQQQGVQFDVLGYHIYPGEKQNSLLSDPWYGTGGPLTRLASFGKPIRINEFHCGEIYTSGYENRAGATVTEACLRSITRHLKELRTQKIANLEAVQIYELADEPNKAVPENRFGLMYDLGNAKPHLHLVTAFAGGTLTAAERLEITKRGLLTDAEINAMQAGGTAPVADTQPPMVGFTSPANGATLKRGSLAWVSAVASDNVGVKEVRFKVGPYSCVATKAPYQCQLRLPTNAGTGPVEARAVDAAGNAGTATITITVR
jgi:hypothetical protein